MTCYMCLAVQTCIALVLISVCLYYWKNRRILALARKLPVILPSLPLLGHAYLIHNGLNGMVNLVMKSAVRYYGTRKSSLAVLWMGFYPIILLFGTEDVQVVLNSEKALDKGPETEDLKMFMGNGLLTSPGFHWKVIRRHFNPIFNPRNMELLVPVLNECGRDLVAKLSHHVGRGHVEVLDEVASVALKSSIFLVLGSAVKVDIKSERFQRLMRALESIHQLIYTRFMKIWLWPELIFRLLYKQQLQDLDSSIFDYIEEHLREAKNDTENVNGNGKDGNISENENSLPEIGETGNRPQLTLPRAYRVLRQNYPGFTDKGLQYEIVTFLTAGTEATKATVSSCLLALATNPDVQDRLFKEIMSVVGHIDTDITPVHIKAMSYLDQVLRETLRKFMIAPIVPRTLTDEIKLSSCTVPAGVTLYMITSIAHLDSTHYPNPEKFDPDRFTPENTGQRESGTFAPFGAGPRMCIARAFSSMSIKILIAHVVRKFKLSTHLDITDLTYKPGAIYLSVDGYKIDFTRRR